MVEISHKRYSHNDGALIAKRLRRYADHPEAVVTSANVG